MIKKTLFILAILAICFSSGSLTAQIIKGEAILGTNLTQVDGDEIYGFRKFGLNVGAGVMIPFDKKGRWDISLEALFSQKGSYQKPFYQDSCFGVPTTGEYNLRLNYVEVPVLVMYTDKEFISAGAGFSWGRLVSVQEYEHGNEIEETQADGQTYSENDFAILGDIRIRLYGPLKFNLRYQYSLVPIRERTFVNCDPNAQPWTRKQYNNVLTFRLIWVFNEKKSQEYYRDARAQ
jgi:hypothetical protein